MVLSGTDSYFGGTVVEAGTLIAATGGAVPGGTSLTIGAGGTFIFDPSANAVPAVVFPSASASSPVSAVPEPGTLALLIVGLVVGFAAWRRRKHGA